MKVMNTGTGLALMALVLFGCKTPDNTKENFDYGRVESEKYINDYFNLTIELPAQWVVQSREQTEKLADTGKDLVAGDDDKMKAILEASEVNVANLISVFQYEVGAAVEYNPNMMIVAENIKNAPGVKNGNDYLFQAKRILEQGQFKYDYLSDKFEKESIGGKVFYTMEARLNYMGLQINQIYYSTVAKGFSFNVIVSFNAEDQKEVLLKSLHSMTFKQ